MAETNVPGDDAEMVRFKLNGEEVEAPTGTTLIRAAHDRGIDVPFFCYHPGLKPEGNCRMCLVEASNARKPVPACTTLVAPDIEVKTHSEEAKSARADVLEFMLSNHPLDCPICDKSGECMLQDNSYGHGKDHSRMVERKELKHTKPLGNEVLIWGNRCIACTRCVRFCNDVAGSGELTMVNRGDRAVVDVFPEYPLFNNLSGNVVDLCPVGALIAEDFLYEARVWYEKKTDSVCHACSVGCNIEVQTLHNKVKRIVPRHNGEVNEYWMCNHGRFDYKYILGPKRLVRYRVEGSKLPKTAGKVLGEKLRELADQHGAGSIAVIGSAWMSLESLYALRRLCEALGIPAAQAGAIARPDGEEETFPGGFRIASDKNPNRAGVRSVLGDDACERLGPILERVQSGSIRALVVVHDLPHVELSDELLEAIGKVELAAVVLLAADERLPATANLFPATAFSEREGHIVNDRGRVQRVRRATQLPRGIVEESELLQDALLAVDEDAQRLNTAGLLRELTGLEPQDVGSAGCPLEPSLTGDES